MPKYNCNVIVCGPAIGKTYLASIDNRFVDIDNMKSIYKYGLYNLKQEEIEKGKLNRGQIINKDSTDYAIKLLEETIKENKIALLSYHEKIIEYLIKNKIKYCLVYANKDLANEYRKRMKKRGNNDHFVEKMTNSKSWNEFYYSNEFDKNPTYKVILKKGEYLSHIKNYFL